MSEHDDFLKALSEKSDSSLPQGFDQRFWDKFDGRFKRSGQRRFYLGFAYAAFPLLFLLIAGGINLMTGFWTTSSLEEFFATQPTLTDVSEDEMEAASNWEVLGLDLDENEFPATDEEWAYLLEGEENGDG